MSGELGRQLEKLAADFNASQSDYRIVPSYKGNYTETVTAAIFAFRSRSQPAIVQVNEIATATMMAAKGAIYPVFELMRDEPEAFSPAAYLPAVTGYYSDVAGNMLSFPFNASTPILYYNKDLFRAAGLDPEVAPKTWPEVGAAAKRLRASGAVCGFTTSWPSWINVENFSAFHNLPIATKANGFGGLDAELTFNNPMVVRHIAQLAEWQTTKVFDYSGRGAVGRAAVSEGRMRNLHRLVGDARRHQGQFEIRGRLRHAAVLARCARRAAEHHHRRRDLWVLRDRPRAEYKGVAKFFAFLSKPEVQAAWHQNTGYLPITRAAFDLTRAQGFYDRNPGTAISIEQMTLKPPTENSQGHPARLVRADPRRDRRRAGAGLQRQETAQAALDSAVERGNRLLRQFERANPDR